VIVVDTSALIAILKDEPEATSCFDALRHAKGVAMSTGTLTEALIVSARRNFQSEMIDLIALVVTDILDVTAARADEAAAAYRRFGKGFHAASLNFGDCFAYGLAREFSCPLLYIGDDFALTDIAAARAKA
jgi:ribonuclease VapC